MEKRSTTISLPKALLREIDKLAKRDHRSRSGLIAKVLEEAVQQENASRQQKEAA